MKKHISFFLAILCLFILAGCSNASGPDENALPPLETAPSTPNDVSQGYERGDSILIYQENLSGGINFELYEDGKLILTGGDIDTSMGDEKAYQDYAENITTIELGEGVTYVGDKAFAGLDKVQKLIIGNDVEVIEYSAFSNCTALTQVSFGEALRESAHCNDD